MREQELFDYLKDTRFPDLRKSEGNYDSFDCISDEMAAFIELKCRAARYFLTDPFVHPTFFPVSFLYTHFPFAVYGIIKSSVYYF